MRQLIELAAPPRRIFCIGRNYSEHIAEMDEAPDGECVVFMKPVTSLVPAGSEVELPRGRGAVHHEVELVVALGAGGWEVPRQRALELVAGATLGLDLTLREVQAGLKARGSPWELSKAFDHSAPLGSWIDPGDLDLGAVEMSCRVNGALRQQGHTRQMLFSVVRLIEILSRTWKLLPGDLIFTGTPAGVGPVLPGDTVLIESPQLGSWQWEFR